MNETNRTTDKEHERAKTRTQRAEDIAYTLNHALSCMTADTLLIPVISNLSEIIRAKPLEVGCLAHAHDNGHGHGHSHGHIHAVPTHTHTVANPTFSERWNAVKHKFTARYFFGNMRHWIVGEAIGDVGAVPLTIGVQRFFPGFMREVGDIVHPFFDGMFRMGAKSAAQQWAKKNFVNEDSKEFIDKVESIYRHEMDHLPQAIVWNLFAFPIGIAGQKYISKHPRAISEIMVDKTIGAVISNVLLIGGRAMAPENFHAWDRWNSEHIIVPATKVIGSTIGIDNDTVDRVAKKQAESEGREWQKRASEKLTDAVQQQAI